MIGSCKIELGNKNTKRSIWEDCMLSRNISISETDFH